jgi:hypothetical protein
MSGFKKRFNKGDLLAALVLAVCALGALGCLVSYFMGDGRRTFFHHPYTAESIGSER